MRFSAADVLTSLAVAAIAGLGGAAIVVMELDDAPGGVLIGLLMVLGAAVLCLRALGRRK